MSEQWEKFLQKQDQKIRGFLRTTIEQIMTGSWQDLDIVKLKTTPNTFRCRTGDIRVIFTKKNEKIHILKIGFRGDVYK